MNPNSNLDLGQLVKESQTAEPSGLAVLGSVQSSGDKASDEHAAKEFGMQSVTINVRDCRMS
jgi:hypothetical protein